MNRRPLAAWARLALLVALPTAAEELLEVRSPRPLQAESILDALKTWETPVSGFFVRSHHGVPAADEARWMLEIDGLVERPLRLTVPELKRLKSRSLHAVLQCAGNGRGLQLPSSPGIQWERGAVGNAEWTGVPLAELLAQARLKANARFLRLEGADKPALPATPAFVRSIPLDRLPKDALVAWRMNRELLAPLHGGPLRLVLPGWYGQNWTKWLTRITLTDAEDPGFYMRKGYRMPKAPMRPGEPWDSATGDAIQELRAQSIIVEPGPDETVQAGEVLVRGKSFSAAPIVKVELSADEGRSWMEAELQAPRPSGGWQSFQALVPAAATGTLTLWSRATDADGRTQPLESDWNPAGYLRNAVDRVRVRVAEDAGLSGAALFAARCQACHAPELAQSQRLTAPQWEGVLKKMEGFGARLQAEERAALVRYLEGLSSGSLSATPRRAGYAALASPLAGALAWATPRAQPIHGKRLFAANCASCHGPWGEGDSAPRVAGRVLAAHDFAAVVLDGRGEMPGFHGRLNPSDLAELRRFLEAGAAQAP